MKFKKRTERDVMLFFVLPATIMMVFAAILGIFL